MGLIRVGLLALMVLFLMVDLGFGQNNAWQIWTKGVEHAAQGNFSEAKVEFEKALKVDPHNGPAKRALKLIEDVDQQKIKTKTARNIEAIIIGPASLNIFKPHDFKAVISLFFFIEENITTTEISVAAGTI